MQLPEVLLPYSQYPDLSSLGILCKLIFEDLGRDEKIDTVNGYYEFYLLGQE